MMNDPVCRTEVDENTMNKTSYGGKDYYFCSKACQSQFQTNPESFQTGDTAIGEDISKESPYRGERSEGFKTEGQTSSQKTEEMADQVKSMASDMKEKVSHRAKSFLESNKEFAAGRLEGTANAFHQTARNFQEESPNISRYVDRVADKIEGAAQYLRENDMKTLLEDSKRFIKSRPALVFGVAVAIGVIAARFLKSSRSES